jgi:predicted transcriptional regulator
MAEKVGELLTDIRKREIVLYIHRNGPKRLSQILKEFNMTPGNVYSHLFLLQEKGYIKKNEDKSYSLAEDAKKIIPIVEKVVEETCRLFSGDKS